MFFCYCEYIVHFRWRFLWRAFSNYFEIAPEGPSTEPVDMVEFMKDKEPVWEDIVQKYDLKHYKLSEIATWWLLNLSLRRKVSCPTDMTKSREMGFLRYENTEKAYFRLFDNLREKKIIP